MTTMTVGDLAMVVLERDGISFTDFEPRDIPGYTSNIAQVVGCSPSQTDSLLRAYDALRDDHHYNDDRKVVREGRQDKEIFPAEIRVILTPV